MDKNLDTSNLEFDYIDKVGYYTKNNLSNKTMPAIERPKILNGILQFIDNTNKIMRQLNAYDSSSILIAESNWMKRNHFKKYTPSENAPKKVLFGQVCTIDYGKTYKGEIGYIHPGLCIGKKDKKYLIIPMTTGKTWRDTCYHPIHNPNRYKTHPLPPSKSPLQTAYSRPAAVSPDTLYAYACSPYALLPLTPWRRSARIPARG